MTSRRVLGERFLISGRKLRISTRRIFSGVPTVTKPIAASSRNEMKMNVPHRLTGRLTFVAQQVEPLGPGYPKERSAEVGNVLRDLSTHAPRKVGQPGEMIFRDHEQMTVRQGTVVHKGDDRLVLIDHGRGDLRGEYFAENAIRIAAHCIRLDGLENPIGTIYQSPPTGGVSIGWTAGR